MIRAGLRRLVLAFLLVFGAAGFLSLAIGLLKGSTPQRSLSVGYMLVGSFVSLVGLAVGMRGWGRPSESDAAERAGERVAASGILIGIGIGLICIGIGLDPRTRIV